MVLVCFFFFLISFCDHLQQSDGGTGCALREGNQEPDFGCHKAAKVSRGVEKPLEARNVGFQSFVLVPGIFQLLALKVQAILNYAQVILELIVSLRGCGDTIP